MVGDDYLGAGGYYLEGADHVVVAGRPLPRLRSQANGDFQVAGLSTVPKLAVTAGDISIYRKWRLDPIACSMITLNGTHPRQLPPGGTLREWNSGSWTDKSCAKT